MMIRKFVRIIDNSNIIFINSEYFVKIELVIVPVIKS